MRAWIQVHEILRGLGSRINSRPRIWLMLAAVFISLAGFEEVVDDVFYDPREGDFEARIFDQAISKFANEYRAPWLNQVMVDLTALGSVSVILTLFLIFASVLASFRDFRGMIFISIVLLGAGVWPALLKLYFERDRPVQTGWLVNVSDLSFPSGHAFGAAAAYIGFSYYASQYARSWTHEIFFFLLGALLAVLVGTSRVYLGVHYPTDVLAGLSGGVAWGLFACVVYEVLGKTRRKPFGRPV